MTDQLKQIGAFDWVTPSQHKNGDPQSGNLIDQMFPLFRTEFHWIAIRLRRGSAMDAGEVARLSDFPNGDEWTFIEIDRVDLLVHESMRQPHFIERSDQSLRLLEFTG
jgi:hypothetical protein